MPAVFTLDKVGFEGSLGPSSPNVDLPGLVVDAADAAEAVAVIEAGIPAYLTYNGRTLAYDNYRLSERGGPRGLWDVTVRFAERERQQAQSASSTGGEGGTDDKLGSWAFDTTGGTTNITQSLGTQGVYGNNTGINLFPLVDFQGAIGMTEDAVEGCEIEIRGFTFQVTHIFPRSVVTPAYIDKLYRLTKRVNNAAWSCKGQIFDAGEVRFRGAQGSGRSVDDFEITFLFHAQENEIDIEVGNLLIPQKLGQDYLWFQYANQVVGSGSQQRLLKVPVFAVIDRVYKFGDFNNLVPF
jgi:hypothetical protein